MKVILPVDGPLDPQATLARYRLWGDDPSNRATDDSFRRVLRLESDLVPYEVRWRGPVDDCELTITAPGVRSESTRAMIVQEVRRIFGLDFDLPAFYRIAKADPVLARLVTPLYGFRPTLTPTVLEMLVGAITAQQVNLAFAFALRASLVRRFGTPVALDGDTVYAFPEPAALARAPVRTYRAMKFSTRKGEYVRGVAQAVVDGRLDLARLTEASADVVIETLTSLHGLGRWTAEWFLARCLGRGDVCPAGDLAVRKVFDRFYPRRRPYTDDAMRRRAREAWGPHQNLAIHYLLAALRLATPTTGGGT
jgi:DNA-3-methyladenine glycosylase II